MDPMENKDGQIESSTSSIPPVIPSPSLPEEFIFWKKKIEEIVSDYQELKENVRQIIAITDERQKLAEKSKTEQEQLAKKIKKIERSLARQTKDNIELLGIFVTLFTFISVSASTLLQFKTVYNAIFFLLAFCFCLLLFLHMFHIILRNEKIGTKCWIVFYIVVLLICTGGAFLCHHQAKKIPNIYEDKPHSIQINYRQTNEYDQTINHEKKIPLNPDKK